MRSASKLDRESDDEEEKEESQQEDIQQHWGTPEPIDQLPSSSSSTSATASATASATSSSPTSTSPVNEEKRRNSMERDDLGSFEKNSPLQLPARRAPRGYKTRSSLQSSPQKGENGVPRESSVRGPSALKRGEGGPRPLIGNNWRTELVAYALEIYFVYIEEDGFAQVNLSTPISTRIASVLSLSSDGKSRGSMNPPSNRTSVIAGAGTGAGASAGALSIGVDDDEPDVENGRGVSMESSKTITDELQGIDMQSVVNLAAKIEKRIDVELLPNLFTDAQEEIFNLMQSDSFRRYIRSHLYRDFVEKEKRERAKLEAMQATALYT